jgi:hypothetical protein
LLHGAAGEGYLYRLVPGVTHAGLVGCVASKVLCGPGHRFRDTFQDIVNLTLIPAGELALRPDCSRN